MTRTFIRTGAAALILAGGTAAALAQPGTGPAPAQAAIAPQPAVVSASSAADPNVGPAGMFVSPAGEVYRPGSDGRPFAMWFRRADANGDGTITWDEFRADFARVFAIYDTDGDGEIEPEEVAHYETVILPEMSSALGVGRRGAGGWGGRPRVPRGEGGIGDRPADAPSPDGSGFSSDGGGRSGRRTPVYSASMTGAARFGLLPIPHPIMEADLNFNRGVTRDEWERAAQRRFTALDSAHNGRLTVPGLLQGRTDTMGEGPRPGATPGEARRAERSRPRVSPGAGGTPLPRE